MQHQWYIARDGKQYGPVSSSELNELEKMGELRETDYLWRVGFSDWKPARQVTPQERNEISANMAPPQPMAQNASPKAEQPSPQQEPAVQPQTQAVQTVQTVQATQPVQNSHPAQTVKPDQQTQAAQNSALKPEPTNNVQNIQEQPLQPTDYVDQNLMSRGAQMTEQPAVQTLQTNRPAEFDMAAGSIATDQTIETLPDITAHSNISEQSIKHNEPIELAHEPVSDQNAIVETSYDPPKKKRSFLKVALYSLLALLLIGAAAILSLPYLVPEATIRSKISQLVKEKTGRDFEMKGKLSYSFYPSFGINVNGPVLHNQPAVKGPPLFEAARVHAKLALMPLLSRKIDVKEMKFIQPNIALITTRSGLKNWQISALQKTKKQFNVADLNTSNIAEQLAKIEAEEKQAAVSKKKIIGALNDLNLGNISFEKGNISLIDYKNNSKQTFSNINGTLSAPGMKQPVIVKGDSIYLNKKVRFNGRINQLESLLMSKPTTMKVNLLGPGLNSNLFGKISTGQNLSFDGQLKSQFKSLQTFGNWLKLNLPLKKQYNATLVSNVKLNDSNLTLQKAKIAVGPQRFNGNISANLTKAKPFITANLSTKQINLNSFITTASNKKTPEDKIDFASLTKGWGITPAMAAPQSKAINLKALQTLDGKFIIKAQKLLYKKLVIENANTITHLKNGVLSVNMPAYKTAGGQGKTLIVVNSRSKKPTFRSVGEINKVSLKALQASFPALNKIEGTGNFKFDLISAGQTTDELIQKLKGQGEIDLDNGIIHGVDLSKAASALKNGQLTSLNKITDGASKYQNIYGSFSIINGKLKNNDLAVRGPFVKATGQGEVNLVNQSVNYLISSTISTSEDITKANNPVNLPIKVSGPFSKLNYALDLNSAITDPKNVERTVKSVGKVIKKIEKNKDDIRGLLDGDGKKAKDLLKDLIGGN